MILDAIDRYKWGILAALFAYICIFIYLQVDTYNQYFEIEPFTQRAHIAEEEEFQLTPDNIEVPPGFDPNAISMTSDVNDQRKESYKEYYENLSPNQAESDIQRLEQQMRNEAGGSAERARLQEMIDERKALQEQMKQNQSTTDPNASTGGDTKYAGETMVSFELKDRTAFQKNNWYVRNPGYKCNNANGRVVIDIKVNTNGDVISAIVNEGQSSNVTSCMRTEALKYAKLSRFAYSASAPKTQSGKIFYTFISKR